MKGSAYKKAYDCGQKSEQRMDEPAESRFIAQGRRKKSIGSVPGGEQGMEKNKELAVEFLERTFLAKNIQSAAEMLTDRFVKHTGKTCLGRAGFVESVSALLTIFPEMHWEMRNIWYDEEFVIVTSKYTLSKNTKGYSVIDIFKIRDGKIDEQWDVAGNSEGVPLRSDFF